MLQGYCRTLGSTPEWVAQQAMASMLTAGVPRQQEQCHCHLYVEQLVSGISLMRMYDNTVVGHQSIKHEQQPAAAHLLLLCRTVLPAGIEPGESIVTLPLVQKCLIPGRQQQMQAAALARPCAEHGKQSLWHMPWAATQLQQAAAHQRVCCWTWRPPNSS